MVEIAIQFMTILVGYIPGILAIYIVLDLCGSLLFGKR